jgi:alginate O-acetyltransferase complex protein AlgJ
MRWPVLLAAALLVLPGAMLAAGMRAAPLFGVEFAAPPPGLSLGALWSGAFQHAATAWFARADPALPSAVAIRNQAYFSLLHQSAVAGIVIGPGLQLVETGNIANYCNRDLAAAPAQTEARATRLAAMQAWYAARGRVFVYLMTPDKVGADPSVIPHNWPCRSGPSDRTRELTLWREALRRHGVRFVDGPAVIAAAHGLGPLFPRGGTHWNWIGASLATQAFVSAVDAARPGALPQFTFEWHDATPDGTDRDLTDLLNLPYPRLDYRTPLVDLTATAPPSCQPLSIAEVGGSFSFQIDFLLARLPCPPRIALYTYFQVERASFAPFTRAPVDPAQRQSELLDTADIVVLEEGESLIFRSRHADQLWALLQQRTGAAAKRP